MPHRCGYSGHVHLAVFCGCPWAATIIILTVSPWKNAMGAINICVALIGGARGKKGHDSPERNPFRVTWWFLMVTLRDWSRWVTMMLHHDASSSSSSSSSSLSSIMHRASCMAHDGASCIMHHEDSWFTIHDSWFMMHHDDASWAVRMSHRDESWWLSTMNHHDTW